MGPFSRRHLIERTGDDRFVVRLDATERQVLADVCGQLADALVNDEIDEVPAFRRLFPVAHADDADLEADYQQLARDDLVSSRLGHLRTVADGAAANELDSEGLERWMLAVNSVRLVFGTVLDVDEGPGGELDPDDPDTPVLVVYHFLGQVLDDAVTALGA